MANSNQFTLRKPKRVVRSVPGRSRARVLTHKLDDGATPYMDMVRKAQLADPFAGWTASTSEFHIIEPRLPFHQLVDIGKRNSALNQCIDAYVVNIESYGYQLEFEGSGSEKGPKAQSQLNAALTFLDNINGDKSLRTIRENLRRDKEYTGNSFMEIGRDILGAVAWVDHIPVTTMRRTKKDKERTEYTMPVRSPDGKIVNSRWTKQFCRFVQISGTGAKTYFKEFGDPRPIDPKTGKVNPALSVEHQATEVYHDMLYSPGEAYGIPRWIGALPAILGLRESELVNLNFFRENAIPAMALLISGGALTEESFDKVMATFNAARGREAMNKILILEAVADDAVGNADQTPQVPKLDMKPMISERQSDGLFKDYEQDAKRKVRSSMRLPAIYTGDSEEYTKATAQSGQRIAESQVFAPERTLFDDFMNRWILPSLGITKWKFKTIGPSVYDPESLGTLVDRFGRHGAMTPNILIKLANKFLDVQIPLQPDKWGDIPFNYTLAMVNGGMQLEGYEDIFAAISDATNDSLTDDSTPTTPDGEIEPSEDENGKTTDKKYKTLRLAFRRELHTAANDIINRINENMPQAA